jgi:hypothetical protein
MNDDDPALTSALAAWKMKDERKVRLPEVDEKKFVDLVEDFLASDDMIGVLGRLDADFAKQFRK